MVFCPCGIFKSNLSSSVFFRCVHLLWFPTTAVKTLRYSHATVRSRTNTARPLPSSNYRHRAKLHSRDLLNLIKSQDFIKLPSWVWEGVLEIYYPISIGSSLILLCMQAKSLTCTRSLGFSLLYMHMLWFIVTQDLYYTIIYYWCNPLGFLPWM